MKKRSLTSLSQRAERGTIHKRRALSSNVQTAGQERILGHDHKLNRKIDPREGEKISYSGLSSQVLIIWCLS